MSRIIQSLQYTLLLVVATILSMPCSAIEPEEKASVEPLEELLPNDSRRWSQHASAIILTDFSKAIPVTALTTVHREKEKWKLLPFETAEFKGSAISTYAFTEAPKVSLPLSVRSWHAIYLGVSTVSTGFREAKNGLQVKLSDEAIFKRMANNLALLPNRVDVIQELWLTVANVNGQSIEIASLPKR